MKTNNSSTTMENPTEYIRSSIRDITDFPKPGIIFKDITTLLADPKALRFTIDVLADYFRNKKIDFIAAPESRGFIFATPVSYLLNCGVTPIRKPGKLPAKTIEHSYELEYGKDTLCIHEDAFKGIENPQVIIIDDLLATGGSCSATIELVEKAGGTVVGAGFVIELGFLEARKKLAAKGVDVFSILNI
jgi:adenine phosphoribosyltransferase